MKCGGARSRAPAINCSSTAGTQTIQASQRDLLACAGFAKIPRTSPKDPLSSVHRLESTRRYPGKQVAWKRCSLPSSSLFSELEHGSAQERTIRTVKAVTPGSHLGLSRATASTFSSNTRRAAVAPATPFYGRTMLFDRAHRRTDHLAVNVWLPDLVTFVF